MALFNKILSACITPCIKRYQKIRQSVYKFSKELFSSSDSDKEVEEEQRSPEPKEEKDEVDKNQPEEDKKE